MVGEYTVRLNGRCRLEQTPAMHIPLLAGLVALIAATAVSATNATVITLWQPHYPPDWHENALSEAGRGLQYKVRGGVCPSKHIC